MQKSRLTSSRDRGEGSADRFEDNYVTTTKISSTSVFDNGDGPSGSMEDRRISSSKNFEQPGGFSACEGNNSSLSKLPYEVLGNGNTHDLAHDLSQRPLTDLPCDVTSFVGSEIAFSLVGQQAHFEKQDMEVNSPIKPIADQREKKEAALEAMGQGSEGKKKGNNPVEKIGKEERKK
nr:hypothetical protein CFP56_26431 [Quercus suber]